VLPATRHKWTHSTLTPARQASTRFTYPGGMEGWVVMEWVSFSVSDVIVVCMYSVLISITAMALARQLHPSSRLERSSEKTVLQGCTARQRDLTGLFVCFPAFFISSFVSHLLLRLFLIYFFYFCCLVVRNPLFPSVWSLTEHAETVLAFSCCLTFILMLLSLKQS